MPKPAKSTKRKKTTSKQTDADRAADARRYQRDKPKRIAAVKAQQEKDPDFPAKRAARAKVNNAVRDGRMKKPSPDADFHHSEIPKKNSKTKPKGRWVKKKTHRKLPNTRDAKVK